MLSRGGLSVYRMGADPGGCSLRKRRQGQPAEVIALADRAQQRLHRRYRRLVERGKPHNKVVVAVGRELVGFVWAALDPRGIQTH